MSGDRRHFGAIPGLIVGAIFDSRRQLSAAGVHRPTMAGISGVPHEGADSIVLSGGYEDDEDLGDVIIYTGHGGNDPESKRQVADLPLTRGNLALARSCAEGLPIRVVRGARLDSPYRPPVGYRYDGLYRVESYWAETGRSGHLVWRFRLVRDDPVAPAPPTLTTGQPPQAEPGAPAPRQEVTTQRLVRSTRVAQRVKELHDHRCQVCGVRLETAAGPYAEGAHVRPLGRPHDGPDREDNVLCLCPNHHALLDLGGITITDDLTIMDTAAGIPLGQLRLVPGHRLDPAHLAYHRGLFSGTKA
jgi:putative restriction endonuclease